MEILVVGEVLPNQAGADHRAVIPLEQAAVGPVGEQQLREPGHAERVDEAGDGRHDNDHHDGGTDLSEHGADPQARPIAVTARSISLMPINGAMMPPTP